MTKCKRCNGSGVVHEHDDYDRIFTFRCHACDGAGEIMTNYDRIIRDMTVEQMAKLLIEPLEQADSGIVFYHTSTGGSYDYEDAIRAEIEWLKKESVT